MSSSTAVKEIAPKRKRMMDMILILGGLKEEAAIPLSRVNEEIANLKKEIEPLVSEILAFPSAYYQRFYEVSTKTNLPSQITDKGILTEAILNIEKALEFGESAGLSALKDALKEVLESMSAKPEENEKVSVDLNHVLKGLPKTTSQILDAVSVLEETSMKEQEQAKEELDSLMDGFTEIISDVDLDADTLLGKLQKIGTKTRYGPFLRVAAQLKRGKREERIDDERFKTLVTKNLVTEMRRGIIMFILNKMGSKTTPQIAGLSGLSPQDIQSAIVSMISRGEVEMVGIDGNAPVFAKVIGKAPDSTLVLKRALQQLRSVLKTMDDKTRHLVENPLNDLETAYSRLQMLGEYDEPLIAEPMKTLQDIGTKVAEAAIKSHAGDDSDELRLLVSAGLEAFARFRLKIALEKGPHLVSGVNVYGEKLDESTYQQIMDSYLNNELERGTILILIRELGAMTTKDLAERTDIPPDRILQHLLRMKRDELLTIAGESHGYILYDVPRTLTEAEVAIQTISSLALQTAEATKDLADTVSDLQPSSIGKLTSALDTLSKARDKMGKIEIGGTVIAKDLIANVEDKIKSAVAMGYRTRARIPSTRPKVTIEDLMDVDVPSVIDEYKGMMGYAPLLGFGTIEWVQSKCLGCKSCEIACPENAIELKPSIDVPQFFEFSDETLDSLPVNKSIFYRTVRNLATVKPSTKIALDEDKPGFGSVEVDLWLCVGCRTCVRRCPGTDDGALELILKWNLPEVIRQITAQN